MADDKLVMEGMVVELQRVERVTDGGVTTKYKAKITARGDDGTRVIKIEDTEPINLVEGEVISISARQVQKTLTEEYGPDVNNNIE